VGCSRHMLEKPLQPAFGFLPTWDVAPPPRPKSSTTRTTVPSRAARIGVPGGIQKSNAKRHLPGCAKIPPTACLESPLPEVKGH